MMARKRETTSSLRKRWGSMINRLLKCFLWAMDIAAIVFTIIPESVFEEYKLFEECPGDKNIILNRILLIVAIFIAVIIIYKIVRSLRWRKTIKNGNYGICIEYGDLFKKKGKKVIAFDECFTTEIGESAPCVKPDSVCGQFLQEYSASTVRQKIENANLRQTVSRSRFQNKISYEIGQIVPYNEEFLLAPFAKLDEAGLGYMPTREDYLNCLALLWKGIDENYGTSDVYVTILGSGRTRMFDERLTSQDLLDMMICSYRLSDHKIKSPYKLHIVCRRNNGVSLNEITM